MEFYHQQQYFSQDMQELFFRETRKADIIVLNAGLDDMTHWKQMDRSGVVLP